VLGHRFPLELVLPLFTSNTARVLGLERRGTLEVGNDGDLLLLDRDTLEAVHVHGRGGWMMRDRSVVERSRWLEGNRRELQLVGTRAGDERPRRGPES
jgi:beta-aspartyl-dipeptidase (metallo-type)